MRHHDLVVIGAGSGNAVVDDSFADLAERDSGRRGRLDEDSVTVYEGRARFIGPRSLRIEGESGTVDISAGQIVVAEPAEVFAGTGSHVTVVEKEERLLGPQDETVAERFTELVRSRYDLRLGRELTAVDGEPGALRLTLDDGATVEADMLLVAVGRVPNSDRLNLKAAGVATHDDGRVVVDPSSPSSWRRHSASTPPRSPSPRTGSIPRSPRSWRTPSSTSTSES
ncbi:FAD-dependent oxidoreductase [Streptomyces zaomyceticus]|uniref:FAD-dependent oxidoreductase n=1 Tax=Streptomyces zaomyceticus TaxID=68286 RepID=UPI00364DA9D4